MKAAIRDYTVRSNVLGVDTSGDYTTIDRFTLDQLRTLLKAGLLDPEEQQNEAPTIRELMEFMEKWPGVYAHGYTIGGERDDARVSLEGLACAEVDVTQDLLRAFVMLCRGADELDIEGDLRAWWD